MTAKVKRVITLPLKEMFMTCCFCFAQGLSLGPRLASPHILSNIPPLVANKISFV